MFNDEGRNITNTCSVPAKSGHQDDPDDDPFDLVSWLKEAGATLG
jgi:hypothetical protein